MPVTLMNEGDNLFASECDVLVNPVNAVGTMGKGLALVFRDRFPSNNRLYLAECRAGKLRAGGLFMGPGEAGDAGWVANLATKGHWQFDSEIGFVESGVRALRQWIEANPDLGIRSVACPALGAGLGGLQWPEVLGVIEREFADSDVEVKLYPPKHDPRAAYRRSPAKYPSASLITSKVRLGDIVPHDKTDEELVCRMVKHMQVGGHFDPVVIDYAWREHWTQGPRSNMVSTGVGYGVIDGGHRFAALMAMHGPDHLIDVMSKLPLQPRVDPTQARPDELSESAKPAWDGPSASAPDADSRSARQLGFRRLSR